MTFVKSRQYREFELKNFGLSIDPSYDDKDLFDFKAGSKHYKNVKVGFINKGRIPKKVG
jgi:hypothetical protein